MIKRIIFFPQNKLSDRDYSRFGLDIIQFRGYEAEVWDFTPVLRPYYFKNYDLPNPSKFSGIKVFYDKKQIEEHISELTPNDIIVCLIHYSESNRFIFEKLDKSNVEYGFISLTSHPETYSKYMRYVQHYEDIKQNPSLLITKVKSRLSNLNTKEKHKSIIPSFIITGGEKSILKFPQYINNKKISIINAHHLDYDIYLNDLLKPKDPVVGKESYAVYIDMYLPFSMDTSHGNEKNQPSANADTFYPVINIFFDEFERKFNVDVVIAAHPRSDYTGEKKSLYGDRLVIRNKTHNLIKYSKCVLTHHSTTAGIAVLYKKPMIFISPNVIRNRLRRRIKFMANNFCKKPINISLNRIPSINIDPINEDAYKEYKNSYIKMEGTPERPIWDIFCDFIDSRNKYL
ncbi:MAG: hypothetical protein IIA61_11370 [Candidatus Marinimicrobia bacterium]|nr:hypothetical protein [Candidatus Neomarinimicrobiota bacterium]